MCKLPRGITIFPPAEKSGFKAGDKIEMFDGQPPLSIADIQWVLHRAKADGAELKVDVWRDKKYAEITLALPQGWRQADDISWRSSSWGLRRMATGGMLLESLDGERPAGVPKDGMALRAKHVGQFGPHASQGIHAQAKQALGMAVGGPHRVPEVGPHLDRARRVVERRLDEGDHGETYRVRRW